MLLALNIFSPHIVPSTQRHFGLSFYQVLKMHSLPLQGAGSIKHNLHGSFPSLVLQLEKWRVTYPTKDSGLCQQQETLCMKFLVCKRELHVKKLRKATGIWKFNGDRSCATVGGFWWLASGTKLKTSASCQGPVSGFWTHVSCCVALTVHYRQAQQWLLKEHCVMTNLREA